MASTTSCPTVNAGCPTPASFPFQPTGAFNPTTLPPAWYNAPTGLETPFFPPTKTYSSIFNKDTVVPPCPPTMMPTPVPVGYPTLPVGYPTAWTPVSPIERIAYPTYAPWAAVPLPRVCPVTGVPVEALPWLNTWCPVPTATPFGYPTTLRTPYELPITPLLNTIRDTVENLCSIAFRPANRSELYCLTNPVRICDREGNRILCLNFDLRGYKPEEINVTLNKTERCIVVEAAHEAKDGKEHHVLRKIVRKFVLPDSLAKIDLAKCEIKSCLTTDGCLTIEMPLPKLTVEEIAKCPIMSKDYVSAPFGLLSRDYSNTTPVPCKIN